MNWERVADVGFAIALVFAFGVSAAAMDSAVKTDPNDVINLDTKLLPLGDQVGELKRDVVKPSDENPESAEATRSESANGDSSEEVQRERVAAGDATVRVGKSSDAQSGTTTDPEIDWLQWLLRHLLLVALFVLGAVGAVVTGVLVGRNRDRLHELLAALLARLGFGDDVEEQGEPVSTPDPVCPNEVARAWYDMVCCLGLDCEQSKTPDECASVAIEAGHDPTVVRTITDAFQSVRYGNRPVTDDLVAQVHAAVESIRERHQQRHQGQEG